MTDFTYAGSGLKLFKDWAVVVQGNRIINTGRRKTIITMFPGHRILSFPHALLLPGLVNLHTHLELPSLLGSIRASSYSEWVLQLLSAKRNLRAYDYRRAVTANLRSLIDTGTTTVGEICTHDISSGMVRQSGLRATVFREIIAMDPDRPIPSFSSLLHRDSSLVRSGLSPHSPHTVSPSALAAISRYAARRDLPLCMHVAETEDENRLLRRERNGLERIYEMAGWRTDWAPRGRSSIDHLVRSKVLGRRFIAVHAVHVDARDMAILKRSGSSIAHCPRSNSRMGAAKLPLKRILDTGIPVGLGTDSLASVPTLNLWDEMRFALAVHECSGISAFDILRLATTGGARAVGLDSDIGSIEPGKLADLIVVPLPRRDTGAFCSDLLRETKSSIMTMVNGRILHRAQG